MKKIWLNKLTKILLIFSISLISRLITNNYFEINVFIDSFHYISILYYLSLSSFICFINDLFGNGYNIINKSNSRNSPYFNNIIDQNVEINKTYQQKSSVIWFTDCTTLHDFSNFCRKYESSLARNYSREDLMIINSKLLEGLATSTEAYKENVKRYMPEDIAVFYGMHLSKKYGSQSDQNFSNPSSWITKDK